MNARRIIEAEARPRRRLAHINQEHGYDCGPTCLRMLAKHFGKPEMSGVDLCRVCGTSQTTGTDDQCMIRGLKHLDISYRIGTARDAESLAEVLERGHFIILRTITRGINHWVIVYDFDEEAGRFHVNDPWLGGIVYTPEQLIEIWAPRDFFYFEIPGTMTESQQFAIRDFRPEDQRKVSSDMLRLFKGHTSRKELVKYSRYHGSELSKVAEVNGQVAGFYLLREGTVLEVLTDPEMPQPMQVYEDLEPYRHRRGVEGVALLVDPQYRCLGIGSALKDAPGRMGFDYIYGYQYKSLGNLQAWLRRRRLVAECPQFYVTLEDL